MDNYNIYSGYYEGPSQNYGGLTTSDFFEVWYKNTRRYEPNTNIYIHGPDVPNLSDKIKIESIAKYNNLGHVDDYTYGKRIGKWCGSTAGMVYSMMHAYLCNVDYVYKEQDCLFVGNCIEQMYNEIGDNGIIFGGNKIFNSAQALFLVKRNYVPLMIKQLAENNDGTFLPEFKFLNLKYSKKFSFGYDRDRPYNKLDKCFYVQQIKGNELEDLKDLI